MANVREQRQPPVSRWRADLCWVAATTPELPPSLLQGELQRESEGRAALSARGFEVFRRLAHRHFSGQCAQAMTLSPKTIAEQQSLIKEKPGVSASAALVHLAIRHRVIDTVGV